MSRGFSLLEVVIACALTSLTFTAVVLVVLGTPSALMKVRTYIAELQYAESSFITDHLALASTTAFTRLHTETREDLVLFAVHGTTSAYGASRYSASVVPTNDSSSPVSLSGFTTDIQRAAMYACSPFLFKNWEQPTVIETSTTLPALAGLTATRRHLIAFASSTPELQGASLFLFSRPETAEPPVLLDSFDLASSSKVGYIASTVTATHLYALSAHTCLAGVACANLDVFRITGTQLTRVRSIPLPQARSIAVFGTTLFIGIRASPVDPEFQLWSIADAERPLRIGSAEIGEAVTDIMSDGVYAYVATADNTIAGAQALVVFDIQHPSDALPRITTFRPPGAGISQKVAATDNMVLLGRSSPSFSKEVYAYDIPSRQELFSFDTDSSITGMVARTPGVFIATRSTLLFWDGKAALHTLVNFSPALSVTNLTCGGRHLYLTQNTAGGGHILTVSGS